MEKNRTASPSCWRLLNKNEKIFFLSSPIAAASCGFGGRGGGGTFELARIATLTPSPFPQSYGGRTDTQTHMGEGGTDS